MNKKILLGIAAFGGIVLISALLPSTSSNEKEQITIEEINYPTLPQEVSINFPTYPDADALNFRETTGDDGKVFYSFQLNAEAKIDDINTWYRNALNQNGWSIKSDKNVAGYQIIQAEKENLFTSMQASNGDTQGLSVINQQAQVRQ